MIHIVRRMLPLLLGPIGALLGSLTGFVIFQVLSYGLDMLWPSYMSWGWLVGLLAYPTVGLLLSLPFLHVYPGRPGPLTSVRGHAEEGHLRTWVATSFALYLPVGVALLYSWWWNAPSIAIPFTDHYLYSGSYNHGFLVATCSIVVLAPFCAGGVERLLRWAPRAVRVLFGPPIATVLAMVAAVPMLLVTGGLVAAYNNGTTPHPMGPLMRTLAENGWETGLMLATLTVVNGALAGTFAMQFIVLPVVTGRADVHAGPSGRRWALPMLAAGVSGALALAGLAQGFGVDSLTLVNPSLEPGQRSVHGTIVAPADTDTYQLDVPQDGIYLMEFPAPGPRSRHQVSMSGYAIQQRSPRQMRYLLEVQSESEYNTVTIMPGYPVRSGVSEYSGPMRFEFIEPAGDPPAGPRTPVEVAPGQLSLWELNLKDGPREVALTPDHPVHLHFLWPHVTYEAGYLWSPGYAGVLLQVSVRGQRVHECVIPADGYTQNGLSLLVADGDPASPPPPVVLRLVPVARVGEEISIPLVIEGLEPGVPPIHADNGISLFSLRAGEAAHLRPSIHGTYGVARLLTVAPGAVPGQLEQLGRGGEREPTGADVLLLRPARLHVTGGTPEADQILVIDAS